MTTDDTETTDDENRDAEVQVTDEKRYRDGGTLRLTDDGIELPDMLRGYVGQFELRVPTVTGQLNTTDEGLPDTEFYDGIIAHYPEAGDYNDHLDEGEIVFQVRGDVDETKFTVVDVRTDDDPDGGGGDADA